MGTPASDLSCQILADRQRDSTLLLAATLGPQLTARCTHQRMLTSGGRRIEAAAVLVYGDGSKIH